MSCRRRPERWTHDPFAADIADGYVYGRGAVDMKDMIALELGVIERLVEEARAAGLDPATDPIPGLRRDVLFTCTADEEAGSIDGARWIAEHRPDWLQAAGAVNECGGVSVTVAGKRLYPIQVAEKGFAPVPDPRHGHVGPRLDAARRQRRRAGGPSDRAAGRARARSGSRRSWPASSRRPPRPSPARRPRSCGGSRRASWTRPRPMPPSTACATRCTPAPCERSIRDTLQPGHRPRRA